MSKPVIVKHDPTREGFDAFLMGKQRYDCPYPQERARERNLWLHGWDKACERHGGEKWRSDESSA